MNAPPIPAAGPAPDAAGDDASATRPEVWYIPGWNRAARVDRLAFASCTGVFRRADCRFYAWDGNRLWPRAAANADAEANRLAQAVADLPASRRARLTLVGHSLGGRMVAHALARLAGRGLKTRHAILLAPAISIRDADLAAMGGGSELPVWVLTNPQDVVLKYIYAIAGGEERPALGENGMPAPADNVREFACPPGVTGDTDIDRPWGRSESLKRICNHLATFYFTELGKILDGAPSPDAQVRVVQDQVNLETRVLDMGVWWDTLETSRGWKLERHVVTRHCRILDPRLRRVAWGDERKMRESFATVRRQLDGGNKGECR